jgi:hypothetical protein
MDTFFDKFTKIISITSITILISSIIKNYIYYTHFNININEFIGITEFPLLFINDIYFYLVLIIIFWCYLPLINLRNFLRIKYKDLNLKFKRTKLIIKLLIAIFIILILINCFLNIPLDEKLFEISIYLMSIFSIMVFYLDKDNLISRNYYFIGSLILIIIFSVLIGFSDIYKIENKRVKYSVSFRINNETFETNTKNYIYLGKTNEYIFILDKSKEQTFVYKFEDINNFNIKRN